MILLIGGQKGGTGKSMLATNFAVGLKTRGSDVLLVDGNSDQGTAANWVSRREENVSLKDIPCVEKSGNIFQPISSLAEKYEDVVIDTGGQDSAEFRSALLVANKVLSPVQASQSDIETIISVNNLIDQAKLMNPWLSSNIVITKAPTHPRVTSVEEAKCLLSNLDGFNLMKTVIYNRKVYMDCSPIGAGVFEMADKKAKKEMELLFEEVIG